MQYSPLLCRPKLIKIIFGVYRIEKEKIKLLNVKLIAIQIVNINNGYNDKDNVNNNN